MSPPGEGPWIIGVDIGGTNVVVGLVSWDGTRLEGIRERPTELDQGPDGVVGQVLAMIGESVEEGLGGMTRDVRGVGIGSPGPLDRASGVVIDTPNLGWTDFPLRDRISDGLDLPAALDNDANCATYGEWWQGAGKAVDTLVGITLGTGIGGGIVLDGQIYHGVSDVAGELGHMTINYGGRRCACGNYGCLEAYASGPNIAARAAEGIRAGAESLLSDMVEGELDRLTARTVYEAVLEEDEYAEEVLTETAKILGVGIANVINILNPEMVVVAGGVTRAGEHLFRPLRAEVRRRAFQSAADRCRIVPAQLPDRAGVIGAAGMFKRVTSGEV